MRAEQQLIQQFEMHPGETTCKRKLTWASIMMRHWGRATFTTFRVNNGSERSSRFCSNEVGNCGCSHAEIKAILAALADVPFVELYQHHCVCCTLYSPCSTCANTICDSRFVNAVVYDIMTRHDTRGVDILIEGGIAVYTLEDLKNGTKVFR